MLPEAPVPTNPCESIQPLGWVLNLTRQILWSVEQLTAPELDACWSRSDPSGSGLSLAQIAIGLEPTPLGLAQIYNRRPYTNPERIRKDLDGAVSNGWLVALGDGLYRVSSEGAQVCRKIDRQLGQIYCRVTSLSDEPLNRLLRLLDKVIAAIQVDGGLMRAIM